MSVLAAATGKAPTIRRYYRSARWENGEFIQATMGPLFKWVRDFVIEWVLQELLEEAAKWTGTGTKRLVDMVFPRVLKQRSTNPSTKDDAIKLCTRSAWVTKKFGDKYLRKMIEEHCNGDYADVCRHNANAGLVVGLTTNGELTIFSTDEVTARLESVCTAEADLGRLSFEEGPDPVDNEPSERTDREGEEDVGPVDPNWGGPEWDDDRSEHDPDPIYPGDPPTYPDNDFDDEWIFDFGDDSRS